MTNIAHECVNRPIKNSQKLHIYNNKSTNISRQFRVDKICPSSGGLHLESYQDLMCAMCTFLDQNFMNL